MVVGAKVCGLTDGFLWFICGLYVGTLTSSLMRVNSICLCRVELQGVGLIVVQPGGIGFLIG